MPRNREINALNWFLTYPKCDATKEEFIENLREFSRTNEVRGAIVAQETHQDGTKHLHAVIQFCDRYRTRVASTFDVFVRGGSHPDGKHGNYQCARNLQACIDYVHKSDPAPLTYGELRTGRKPSSKETRLDQLVKALKEGSKMDQIEERDPGSFCLHKRKLEDYQAYLQRKKIRTNLEPKPSEWKYNGPAINSDISGPSLTEYSANWEIEKWLNANLCRERAFKSPALWIHGPPNMNKTSLFRKIGKYYSIYWMPIEEHFFDDYVDEDYDLVVLDEYKGQHTIQFLNNFIQGGIMSIRKKGSQYLKMKNIPTVILSNYSPVDAYSNANKSAGFEALMSRLVVVQVNNRLDLAALSPVYQVIGATPQEDPAEEEIDWENASTEEGLVTFSEFNPMLVYDRDANIEWYNRQRYLQELRLSIQFRKPEPRILKRKRYYPLPSCDEVLY
ncbi:Rep [uncultured virus]|uniref:Rep n=1 Tax=uncultured virus TaxID=340016 RepID=A0A2K9LS80_9VIRU|nr:Rep [uncultured virus]